MDSPTPLAQRGINFVRSMVRGGCFLIVVRILRKNGAAIRSLGEVWRFLMKNRIIVSFLAVMTIMSVSLSAMVGGRRAPAVVAPKASRPVAVPQAPAVPQTPKFNANAIKAKIEELLRVDGTTKTSVIAAVKKISTGQAFTAWITALEQSLNEARNIKTPLTLDDAKRSGVYTLVLFVRGLGGYTVGGKTYKGITREFNEQFFPSGKPANVDSLHPTEESRLYQEKVEQVSAHEKHAAEHLADLLGNDLFTGPMSCYHEELIDERFLNTLEFSNEVAEQYFTEVIAKLINNARGANGSMWTKIKALYKAHPYLINTAVATIAAVGGSIALYKSEYSPRFNGFVDAHNLHDPRQDVITKFQVLWAAFQAWRNPAAAEGAPAGAAAGAALPHEA